MKKNILLIGGSSGIGLAVVKQMHNTHNIFVASRTKDNLVSLDINHIQFDTTKESLNLDLLPDELHGFVYCPGSINLKPFKMLASEKFEEEMHLNFFALIKVFKAIVSRLTANSSVIFFSTVAVQKGMPFHTSVAAAKGAIEGFGKALAAEYATKFRVNIIAPSLVDTPLAKRLLNNDKKKETNAMRHPMQRIGTPDDIANMVVFLLSDNSSWMTGQVIAVDGGTSTLNVN
ncbi:SDR family oxidoreductase [Aurantibacter sp.]|uniref:SDR family NAD(P)-dependent oxidoreductase n=1 Tax=Aurantibacter sp. TaxID=2807103 RepID=UPI003267A3F0